MLNETISNNCTYATCSVKEYGQLEYIPSLAGNMLYLSIFALCLLCQLVLGIRHRTWGYMIGMFGGLVLEILGYVARVQLHYDVFSEHKFTNYVIGTTIGPAFFSMSIYLCLARIMYICGIELSSMGPRTITAIFVCCDLLSIVLQALGGSLSVTAKTIQQHNKGIHITIAGLSSQVGSMIIFIGLCSYVAWIGWTQPSEVNEVKKSIRSTFQFRRFVACELSNRSDPAASSALY
jgi:hypothetical protein